MTTENDFYFQLKQLITFQITPLVDRIQQLEINNQRMENEILLLKNIIYGTKEQHYQQLFNYFDYKCHQMESNEKEINKEYFLNQLNDIKEKYKIELNVETNEINLLQQSNEPSSPLQSQLIIQLNDHFADIVDEYQFILFFNPTKLNY